MGDWNTPTIPQEKGGCVRTATRNQTRLGPRHGLLNRGVSQGIGRLQSPGSQSHIRGSFGRSFAACQREPNGDV